MAMTQLLSYQFHDISLAKLKHREKINNGINKTSAKRSHVNVFNKHICFASTRKLFQNICLLLPFSRHFAFILTTIFPDFVISNNIALCVFSLRVSSWRGRLDSLFLRSAFVVIKARRSCPPCRIGKSASRSSSNSTCVSSSHELFSVCAFYL